MNKILVTAAMLLILGTSGYATENESKEPQKEIQTASQETVKEDKWWEHAGDPTSEYWWISSYEDQSE